MKHSLTLGLLAILVLFCALGSNATPLDDYVNKPDPTFKWTYVNKIKQFGITLHNVYLTSQTWLTAKDTNHPVWTHWLQICIPDVISPLNSSYAFIYIDGGRNADINDPPTKTTNQLASGVCLATGQITANLNQIPNQPIVFTDDPRQQRRSEDAIIGYSWARFFNNTNDPTWLVRLPMTKAVVRAMDVIEEFTGDKAMFPNGPKVKKFFVSGASKRGWTTYTVAAVDKRVAAMIPIVIPVGNLQATLQEMWRAYGNWSFALEDYVQEGVTHYINRPEFQKMLDIVGPSAYMNRYTFPKYIICAAGDEFFLPNSANFFINDFIGETHLRIVANAEHSMAGHATDVTASIASFMQLYLSNTPRPQFKWSIDDASGAITVVLDPKSPKPSKVRLFYAHNPKKHDFRLLTCGRIDDPDCINPIMWMNDVLEDTTGTGVYVGSKPTPASGWLGMLIQVEYKLGGISAIDPLKFSTGVSIIPKTFPYPPCPPSVCG